MIRIRIAVALLKWSGALVEYRVRRIKAKKPGSNVNVDGTTLYRTESLPLARDRFLKARIGHGEVAAVQLVARILERHHTVSAPLVSVADSASIRTPPVAASGDSEVVSEKGNDQSR